MPSAAQQTPQLRKNNRSIETTAESCGSNHTNTHNTCVWCFGLVWMLDECLPAVCLYMPKQVRNDPQVIEIIESEVALISTYLFDLLRGAFRALIKPQNLVRI